MERWWVWLVEVLAAPLLFGLVSVVYFMASPKSQPMRKRILVSAHGVVVVMLYAGRARGRGTRGCGGGARR